MNTENIEKNSAIDFVIPWVDGSDPIWLAKKQKFQPKAQADAGINRYRDWETLKYWFRGVEKFAPWVHKVYFVTDGQVPNWLNRKHKKLSVINHEDYIPHQYLPTFSSHPIELNIHRIPNLSEQFVYFNDDLFLLRPVKSTIFFKNNLPCDDAILSPIIIEETSDAGKMCANDMGIINKHFEKKDVVRKFWRKWFNPVYGEQLLRTFCLMPWRHLVGFYNDHLPQAFLKSTFDSVWAAEPKVLNEICTHKFRDYNSDVNQWLMRYWQLCEGKFIPISPKRGVCYRDVCKDALFEIRRQSYYMICINDNSETDFNLHKRELLNAFESILPEKSDFEII